MTPEELSRKLRETLSHLPLISTQTLAGEIALLIPEMSSNSIPWKINQLKKEKLIFQTGRGQYTFQYKPLFNPSLSLKTKRFYNRIKRLCNTEPIVWDIGLLKQIGYCPLEKNWIFLAVPKNEMEDLFDKMLDFSKQVFLNPDKEIISRYIHSLEEAVILVPLISETPIEGEEYLTITLEGLLVNVWMNNENYLKPLGFEIKKLFETAFGNYNINQSKLLRYAARRDQRDELQNLIKAIL